MENFKGYVYTIFSGLGLLIALIFVALQWGGQSKFSAFGPEVTTRTIWLVLASAGGGVVAFWLMRLLARGVRILWKVRHRPRPAELHDDTQVAGKDPDEDR
jgi:hypothetical protein